MGFGRSQTLLPSRRTTSVTALVAFALWLVMSGTASAGEARTIGILDRCDPESFNAALEDPEACVGRNGGVHFDTFLERVNPKDGGHSAWRFSPGRCGSGPDSSSGPRTAVVRCTRSRKSSTSAVDSWTS